MTEPTTEPTATEPTPSSSPAGRSRWSKAPTRLPIYRLVLRSQVTRARLAALLGLGVVGIIVGAALGASPRPDLALDSGVIVPGHLLRGARFVSTFGLSLVVPVTALVFAAASLGDPDEEGTLVYLWLRPVRRVRLVVAAAAASFTVAWPVVVIPLAIAAAATRGGADLVVATVASATVALVAYTGIFCALGLVTRRSLVWGLLYIFIWEGFVATAADSAAQLAVRTYARSVLESITDVPLRGTFISSPWSLLVPVAVGVAALAFATWRLIRRDIA